MSGKKMRIILLGLAFLLPLSCLAKIGVGIGTGKIQIDQKVTPGGIYVLPPIVVQNTGDEAGAYGFSVEYLETQPELKPAKEWFTFSPSEFSLQPGETQIVDIHLNLPLKVTPGNYFAYLEAHPTQKATAGNGASVGIAAASKLYFTVVPANVWQAFYYKALALWTLYTPWPKLVTIFVSILIILIILKRFFSFEIGLKKKPKV